MYFMINTLGRADTFIIVDYYKYYVNSLVMQDLRRPFVGESTNIILTSQVYVKNDHKYEIVFKTNYGQKQYIVVY